MRRFAAASLAACLAAGPGLAVPAAAMSVNPIVLDLETAGSRAAGQLNVVNPNPAPMPVEIEVERLALDGAGAVSLSPDPGDFLILPPQAVVAPGATQVFRIQYVGDPDLATSQTYQFTVRQVPVSLPEGTTGIQVVYSITTLVTVAPAGEAAAVKLVAAEIGTNEAGAPAPVITLENAGAAHSYLSRGALSLRQRDGSGAEIWSLTLSPDQVASRVGVGLLPAKQTRRFVLPFALPQPGGTLEAEFTDERAP